MNKKGFTLIELLVVIAIIGILSAVVLTSLNSSRQKARDTKKVSDVKQVALAYELHRDQTSGAFDTSTAALTSLNPFPSDVTVVANTSNADSFCVYATLEETSSGAFFAASETSAGYTNDTPVLGTCPQ